jgi:hypothetical protein
MATPHCTVLWLPSWKRLEGVMSRAKSPSSTTNSTTCDLLFLWLELNDTNSDEPSLVSNNQQDYLSWTSADALGLDNITAMYWDWALATTMSPDDDIRVGRPCCTEIEP